MSKIAELNATLSKPTPTTSKQLVEIEEVPNTPFHTVGQDGKYFLAFGKYRMSTEQDSHVNCRRWMTKNRWQVITNLAIVIAEMVNERQATEHINQLDNSTL